MQKKLILVLLSLFLILSPVFSDAKDDLINKLLAQNKVLVEQNSDLIKVIEDNSKVITDLKDRIEKDGIEIAGLRKQLEDSNPYIKDQEKFDLGIAITYPTGGNIIFGFYPFNSLPVAFYSSNSIVNIDNKIYFIPSLGIKILF
jgi:hypothetical protein